MDDYGLTIEVRQESGHVLVTVAGEVDIATVSQPRATASVRPDHTASAASGLVNAKAESTGNIRADKCRRRMLSRAEREHAHYVTGHRSKLSYG
jgi:hypothetical protein